MRLSKVLFNSQDFFFGNNWVLKVGISPSKLYNICVLPIEDTICVKFMFRLLNNIFFRFEL
jgi:hypothetical protein